MEPLQLLHCFETTKVEAQQLRRCSTESGCANSSYRFPATALTSFATSAFQLLSLSIGVGGASTAVTALTVNVLHELPLLCSEHTGTMYQLL